MRLLCCVGLSVMLQLVMGLGREMPRFLGKFDLPHAGFVEVMDREDGGKDMYFTTFNPALPLFHDPVYFLRDPGNYLGDVTNWPQHLGTLGSKASAYWPNFPIQVCNIKITRL